MPTSITFSQDGRQFVTMSFPDRQVRVFKFLTGKLFRKYDESIQVISEMQQVSYDLCFSFQQLTYDPYLGGYSNSQVG